MLDEHAFTYLIEAPNDFRTAGRFTTLDCTISANSTVEQRRKNRQPISFKGDNFLRFEARLVPDLEALELSE